MTTSARINTDIEQLQFLSPAMATHIADKYGTPVYIYSEDRLRKYAREALAFKSPFGLIVRFAMKANPLAAILRLFDSEGIHIDASSGYEVERAIKAGIDPSHIMLTSQQMPPNLGDLLIRGVKFNATSLHQLEIYGKNYASKPLAVRINAGIGSGHHKGVSVAGPTASFGIWHEYTDEILAMARKYSLTIDTIHSHIGCGTDPIIWQQAAKLTLNIIESFPEATNLNLGGGFKVARTRDETATDLQQLSESVSRMLIEFAERKARKLHLEIEPGTFLTANAGTLLAQVQDMSSTGDSGYNFLKLNTGMNDIMRPALHASQHPIISLSSREDRFKKYVVVGHNCESSDLLTPSLDDAEVPEPRLLNESAVGDLIAIEGTGAYCSSMRLIGYNSFPAPNEVMVSSNNQVKLIYRGQTIEDLTSNEVH